MTIFTQLLINSITVGAVYGLVALGFNLTLRSARFFNLAHGTYCVIGGYGVYWISILLGLPIWLGVLFGIAAGAIIAYLSDILIFKPMRKQNATPMTLLVASIGLFTALQAIIAIFFSSQFQSLRPHNWNYDSYTILGATITPIQILIVLTTLITAAGLYAFLTYTTFGKAIKAISDDIDVARIVGINADKTISIVFAIGGAIAAVAGIFTGFDTGIMPISGLMLVLAGITSALIGGLGNYWSGLIGALIFGIVENFGVWFIGSEWRPTIVFSLLIVFLVFRPQGLFTQ